MVVHGDQAEQMVVGLGHRLGRPVLVDRADLESLQVAAVGVGAAGLPCGLVGLDFGHVQKLLGWARRENEGVKDATRLPGTAPSPIAQPSIRRTVSVSMGARRGWWALAIMILTFAGAAPSASAAFP